MLRPKSMYEGFKPPMYLGRVLLKKPLDTSEQDKSEIPPPISPFIISSEKGSSSHLMSCR